MRTLSEIMNNFEEIWFFVDDDVRDAFADDCRNNGFVFMNGDEITSKKCGGRMGISTRGKTLGHVMGMIWHYSFSSPKACLIVDRIDSDNDNIGALIEKQQFIRLNYKAFISGDDNCVYESPDDSLSSLKHFL